MIGEVHLIRKSNKIVPAIILKEISKGIYLTSQLKKPTKNEQNVVKIGQPEGLNYNSVAICYRLEKVERKDILKCISIVSLKTVAVILETHEKYNNYHKFKELHKELHIIKNKINAAQFNNENYKELEKRRDEIFEELGYEPLRSSMSSEYKGIRYIPNSKGVKIIF